MHFSTFRKYVLTALFCIHVFDVAFKISLKDPQVYGVTLEIIGSRTGFKKLFLKVHMPSLAKNTKKHPEIGQVAG
jgi:hypothetical protein